MDRSQDFIQSETRAVWTAEEDKISLKEMLLKFRQGYRYLLSKFLILVLAAILGGAIGFSYSLFKKPIYTAETTFVLEEGGSGGGALGQYSGLASVVGIDIGGSSADLFSGDNIIQLYKSRSMIEKSLLSMGSFDGKDQLLIERYIESNNLRKDWGDDPSLNKISFNSGVKFTLTHDSIMAGIIKDIRKDHLDVSKPDKKLSIIKVTFVHKDELFAKQFSEQLVNNVSDFFITTKTKKMIENIAILQHQTDSVRAILNGAISLSAATMDATPNLNPTRQMLRAPIQRSQVNAEANKAILSELIKNLELSKYTLRKERPLIQLIDGPVLPLEEKKVGKGVATLFGILISLFLVTISLFVRAYIITVLKNSESSLSQN